MKELAKSIGSILGFLGSSVGFIALLLFRVAWKIVKTAVFLAILWGAVTSLSDTSVAVIGDIVTWAKTFNPGFFGASVLSWVAKNWMTFALLVIFLNSVFRRAILDKLETTSTYMRIFIATMMNYLGIDTETPNMAKMQESGILSVMKEAVSWRLFFSIFGVQMPDDSLMAKAVRGGQEVCLSDDVKEAFGEQGEKRENVERW